MGAESIVFPLSYGQLHSKFHDALKSVGLERPRYTCQSLRHGGASTDWILGRNFDEIKNKRRWLSDKSFKRYLDAGKGLLLPTGLSTDMVTIINRLADQWNYFSDGVGGRAGRSARDSI